MRRLPPSPYRAHAGAPVAYAPAPLPPLPIAPWWRAVLELLSL